MWATLFVRPMFLFYATKISFATRNALRVSACCTWSNRHQRSTRMRTHPAQHCTTRSPDQALVLRPHGWKLNRIPSSTHASTTLVGAAWWPLWINTCWVTQLLVVNLKASLKDGTTPYHRSPILCSTRRQKKKDKTSPTKR